MTNEIVHLHNHSSHSFLDGQSSIKEMVARAKELELDSLAITNHGNIFAWVEFYQECKKAGIKPILGCLLRGQEIVTSTGVKPVEDIDVGDLVLTHKGRFRKVLQTSTRIHTGRLYTINLAGHGGRGLTLTDEHPVLVRDYDGNINWIRADEIVSGRPTKHLGIREWNTYVGIPKLENKTRDRTKPTWIETEKYLPDRIGFLSGTCKKVVQNNKYESQTEWPRIKQKIKLTGDLSYLLGLFAAEGSYGRYKNGTLNGGMVLTFHINEDEYVEEVQKIVLSHFGLNSTVKKRPKKNTQEVFFNCLPLAHIVAGLVGVGSHNKKVPIEILEGTPKVRRHFLQGLLDGDGKNPNKKSNIGRQSTLKTASKNLAWGCRQLLADEGHWTNVAEVIESESVYYQVPCSFKRRYARSIEDDDYIWKPIQSIDLASDSVEVFNFEVEEDNSYVSDFILHNCEFYLTDNHDEKHRHAHHLVVLAENETGLRNIVNLTTAANRNFYFKPRIDLKDLEAHKEGIVVLTACMHGPISYWLFDKMTWPVHGEESKLKEAANIPEAYRFGNELKRILGYERLYLEVQDGGIPEQVDINKRIRQIGIELGLRVVATQDAHYVYKEDAEAHGFLKSIAFGKTAVEQEGGNGFSTNEFYIKNRETVLDGTDIRPEEVDMTREIAARCNVELELHKMRLPKYPGDTDESSMELLKRKLREGWVRRGIVDPEGVYAARVKHELRDIDEAGLADYFLIISDVTDYCRDNIIMLGPGRGSAGGAFVSFLLGATQLDPIRYGLIWERFYNAGRKGSMPDIDTDVEKSRREEVIAYIRERFGEKRVAQIINLSSLGAKQVLRDVFKVAGIDENTKNIIAGLVPAKNEDHGSITLKEAIAAVPKLKEYAENEEEIEIKRSGRVIRTTSWKNLFDIALRLEGCYKTTGVHAAGLVIADDDFDRVGIPLVRQKSMKDLICGWDMDAVDTFGFMKLDMLGLATLDVLKRSAALIKERHGVVVDFNQLDLTDQKVFDLLSEGHTQGVFQLESNLGKVWSKKCKPQSVEEIGELTAIIRPACLDTGMADTYVKIKRGEQAPAYIHEILRPILEPTKGILLYQEQVIKICQVVAQMDLKEADAVRKVVGKKKPEELRKKKEQFMTGAEATVGKVVAEEIWGWIELQAGYGFNKSHAIAYGLLAYWTAWVKVNYYTEFLCANLIHAKDKIRQGQTPQDVIALFVNDGKLHGVDVVPPRLEKSQNDFTILDDTTISFGFFHIKGVGVAANKAIGACKSATSFVEFLSLASASKMNRSVIDAFIASGVLDGFGVARRSMKAQHTLTESLTAKEGEMLCGVEGESLDLRIAALADESTVDERKKAKIKMPNVRRRAKLREIIGEYNQETHRDSVAQILIWEKRYLGATLSGSMADLNRAISGARHNCLQVANNEFKSGWNVELCVVVEGLREVTVKNGKTAGRQMAFISLSDSSYTLDGSCAFPDLYDKIKSEGIGEGDVVSVRGKVSERGLVINSMRRL